MGVGLGFQDLGLCQKGEKSGLEAFGDDALQLGEAVFIGLKEDFAFVVGDGDEVHAVEWNGEFHADNAVDEQGVETVVEVVKALPGMDGDGHSVGEDALEFVEPVRVDEIDFIEDEEGAFVSGSELVEDGGGGGVELLSVGGAGVDDVDEEVGEDGFFKGGSEGLDEIVWEIADEADGVGEQHVLAVGEFETAGGGVEGGEEFVFGKDFGGGEAVEQGRFADVGVADDGGVGQGDAAAFFAHGIALFFDFFEFGLDAVEAFVGEAAVGFELGLALAPSGGGTSATGSAGGTALAVEVGPHAGEAGDRILEAGEFDLKPSLSSAGAHVEDVEDDLMAVDDAEFGIGFPSALLGRGELVIDDDAVCVELFGLLDEFGGFAAAEEVAGGGLTDHGEFDADDADAEGRDEFFELFHQIDGRLHFTAVEVGTDEEGALDDIGSFSDIKHGSRCQGKRGKTGVFLLE